MENLALHLYHHDGPAQISYTCIKQWRILFNKHSFYLTAHSHLCWCQSSEGQPLLGVAQQ